ncbi:hypothetical protein ACFL1H_04575 [Nanoarchaeota archaeon]
MASCCNLGKELDNKTNILFETDNFFVTPTIGQMNIEGYLLLCSKKHYLGVGDIPDKYHNELEELLENTRKLISSEYNSDTLVFEHGPKVGCFRGGGCLDHAHLHILPLNYDIITPLITYLFKGLQVKDFYKLERIDDLQRLNEISQEQNSSYLMVEDAEHKRYVTEVNFFIPSQYLRQIVASKLERSEIWNWRTHPDYETFEKTILRLKDKF